jgi:hypothetical protein
MCDESGSVFLAQTTISGNICVNMLNKFALYEAEKHEIANFYQASLKQHCDIPTTGLLSVGRGREA